jgi:hypothetical protein
VLIRQYSRRLIMKKSGIFEFPEGSAERVIAHARFQQSRGRNLSMSFGREKNPLKALKAAQIALAAAQKAAASPKFSKEFHISDVLSITTGRLMSTRHMEGIYDILNYMTQDNLFTHQLPRAGDECKPWILFQHPDLDSPEMHFALGELVEMLETPSGKAEPDKLILGWLSKITSGQYGIKIDEMLSIEPLYPEDHEVRDPLEEAREMAPHAVIIGIELDPDDED